jgi:hypothetical protein
MNKPHKHAELIKAWADGATIQWVGAVKHGGEKVWMDIENPDWESEEYRIKPEPKPDWCMYLKRIDEHTWTEYLPTDNIQKGKVKLTFDGETGELKSAEVLK